MKRPIVGKPGRTGNRADERGVTIALVALAIVAVMAIAALSVDVVTLYLANSEAQRSADGAALAAARVLSITGVTGDPANATLSNGNNAWQQACLLAAQVATALAKQNSVGGAALSSAQVQVTFPNNSDPSTCANPTPAFGVNPLVTVKVQRTDLPTFFARIWGYRGATVGATATAEAFNSSNSGNVGNNGPSGTIIPVQPRCVKPWIVPNQDPGDGGCGGGGCNPFVLTADGSIQNPGIIVNGTGPGVIGETFTLFADCKSAGPCSNVGNQVSAPPQANASPSFGPPPNLQYVPGQLPASSVAFRSCAGSDFQEAIAGCDQTTLYQCGNPSQQSTVDLSQINVPSDSAAGAKCLIGATDVGPGEGQDTLDQSSYPYRIKAGSSNLMGLSQDTVITSSNSIVSLPIYDSQNNSINLIGTSSVTIVGFLQVFINQVNADSTYNSIAVTILNVTGCGNGTTTPVGNPVFGSSPVPVRLIKTP